MVYVNLFREAVGVAEDHERGGGFPEAQDWAGITVFTQIQQCFVAGEVGLGRGQREIQVFHL